METVCLENAGMKIECGGSSYRERLFIRTKDGWAPAMESAPFATLPSDERYRAAYALEPTRAALLKNDSQCVSVRLEHPDHRIDRTLSFGKGEDTVDVTVVFTAKKNMKLRALEDVWNFLPKRREEDSELRGPLDFVWSQRIKSFPGTVVSHYNFRTPVIMMQQGEVFAGLIPGLEEVDAQSLQKAPLGMDLNVTADRLPWMSCGIIVALPMSPDKPCEAGHSQLVRGSNEEFCTVALEAGESLTYRYTVLASAQPVKLGYRRAVRYLWERYGASRVALPESLPANPRFPGSTVIGEWRREIWEKRTNADYFEITKDNIRLGGIAGRRQGEWFSRTDNKKDLWYATWLQELLSGYGMYLYGRSEGGPEWVARAETMLNVILAAPRTQGMFPVICYYEADGGQTWLRDDGWAGYPNEFHAVQMSWTAWLMLRWGRELFPERREDILRFCIPYAEFLLSAMHQDGCIPAWYDADGKPSRLAFRDFNAETAVSALFLLELYDMTGEKRYFSAGEKALGFITAQVRPRQRWSDMETFLSCSRKSFSFYDSITAQYPQCNLSEIHAAIAYLRYYQITREEKDREQAVQMLDYLLLTQQLWNHPLLHIHTFGGFTVQNTDHEWSDVREALCAVLLYRYYRETGEREYLERGIAAMHAGFEVLPFENWAHCGYEGMQYDSSLLWGGALILSAAEYYEDRLGTVVVDADREFGIGVNGCVVKNVSVEKGVIRIEADMKAEPSQYSARIFSTSGQTYTIEFNYKRIGTFTPEQLRHKVQW